MLQLLKIFFSFVFFVLIDIMYTYTQIIIDVDVSVCVFDWMKYELLKENEGNNPWMEEREDGDREGWEVWDLWVMF